MSWADAIGWCAGSLVMLSGLPNILRNLRATGPPVPSLLRDVMQLAGNLGWVAYGLLSDALPIAALCSLNALFMTVLILQQLRRARSRGAAPTDDVPTKLKGIFQ